MCLCCSDCKWKLTIDLNNLASIYLNSNSTSFKGEIQTLKVTSAGNTALKLIFSLPRYLFVGVTNFLVFIILC